MPISRQERSLNLFHTISYRSAPENKVSLDQVHEYKHEMTAALDFSIYQPTQHFSVFLQQTFFPICRE